MTMVRQSGKRMSIPDVLEVNELRDLFTNSPIGTGRWRFSTR